MAKLLFSDCHPHTGRHTKAKLLHYGFPFILRVLLFHRENLNKMSNLQLEALVTLTHRQQCNAHNQQNANCMRIYVYQMLKQLLQMYKFGQWVDVLKN